MATHHSLRGHSVLGTFGAGLFLLVLTIPCSQECSAFGDAAAVVVAPTLDRALSKTETSAVPTRESLRLLSPGEREQELQQLREKRGLKVKPATPLAPADREQRRVEIRQRLNHRLEALRQKRKTAPLTAEEEKQLHRLESLSHGFQPALKKAPPETLTEKKTERGVPSLHTEPTPPK
ncbi:MAG: hypothetical protein HY299_21590 [Verrucomicrobia bacterium]|nr:hypothetical protein [Verrucomicrobiota bacterium]